MIAVISDTHMPRGDRRLPDACLERLRSAELILHAGDVMTATAFAELELIGPPVLAVHGNVDDEELRRQLPAERVVEWEGARIGMVHDAGSRRRPARHACALASRTPTPSSSATPTCRCTRTSDGFQIFNPGSPTERRRAPERTMGIARVEDGRVSFELIGLGRRVERGPSSGWRR